MKSPPIQFSNVTNVYKTDWFLTDNDARNLKQDYVFNNASISPGDIYSGMYVGIHRDDFNAYISGKPKYRLVLVNEAVMKRIKQ